MTTREIIIGMLALSFSIAIAVVAVVYRDYLAGPALSSLGLIGVLLISFIAGSSVSVTMIPVPYWLVVFTLSSTLAPLWGIFAPAFIGATSATGASLGEFLTFLIGYGGRRVSERLASRVNERLYRKAKEIVQRHGSWAVFLTSAVINPFHLPMTLAIATLRFHPAKWLLLTFLGNLVKSLAIAFAGYFTLDFVIELFE